jgi:hypothetical protein
MSQVSINYMSMVEVFLKTVILETVQAKCDA